MARAQAKNLKLEVKFILEKKILKKLKMILQIQEMQQQGH